MKWKVTLKDGMYNPNTGIDADTTYEYVEAENEDEAWSVAQEKFMQEYFHHPDGGHGQIVVDVQLVKGDENEPDINYNN